MIEEDYVSYEVANLLKEKGFDEKTLSYYEDNVLCRGDWFEWNRSPFGHISAPTHQMAMKWLREVHNISVEPFSDWVISDEGWICLWSVDIAKIVRDGLITELTRKSYEEAVEAALKYSFEKLV